MKITFFSIAIIPKQDSLFCTFWTTEIWENVLSTSCNSDHLASFYLNKVPKRFIFLHNMILNRTIKQNRKSRHLKQINSPTSFADSVVTHQGRLFTATHTQSQTLVCRTPSKHKKVMLWMPILFLDYEIQFLSIEVSTQSGSCYNNRK